MQSLTQQLRLYNQHHSSFTNKVLHDIGIPLIIFSLMIFFGWFHFSMRNVFDLSLAWLLIVAALAYYFWLDWMFAAVLTIVFVILNFIASLIAQFGVTWFSLKMFLFCFIVGWGLLLVGHFLEHKHPAFTKSLLQLLIAPVYIVAEVFFYLGYRKDLQHEIESSTKS